MGIRATISSLAPLLQPRRVNPHATLITLFLNAVMQVVKMGGDRDALAGIADLADYLPPPPLFPQPSRDDPRMMRLWDARTLALNAEELFDQYVLQNR